jgi:hypothetical protein
MGRNTRAPHEDSTTVRERENSAWKIVKKGREIIVQTGDEKAVLACPEAFHRVTMGM